MNCDVQEIAQLIVPLQSLDVSMRKWREGNELWAPEPRTKGWYNALLNLLDLRDPTEDRDPIGGKPSAIGKIKI